MATGAMQALIVDVDSTLADTANVHLDLRYRHACTHGVRLTWPELHYPQDS